MNQDGGKIPHDPNEGDNFLAQLRAMPCPSSVFKVQDELDETDALEKIAETQRLDEWAEFTDGL
jgi:hypothetical protein